MPDQEYPAADFSPKACAESFRINPSGTPCGLSRDDRLDHFLEAVNRPNPSVTLGEIDSCFQHWAHAKDPASDECRTLAAIFSCAVDGGEVGVGLNGGVRSARLVFICEPTSFIFSTP